MIRVLIAVMVMAFATTAQAGIYRCTITKAFDGLRDQSEQTLDGLAGRFNPIVLNTENRGSAISW